MSFDKNELAYLLGELKKVFVSKVDFDNLKSETEELRGIIVNIDVVKLQNEVDSIKNDIVSLKGYANDINTIRNEITRIKDNVALLQNENNIINNKVTEMQITLEEMQTNVDNLVGENVDKIKNDVAELRAEIDDMKEIVDSSIQENVADIINDIDNINADIESMRGDIDTINADIESMKEVDNSINADIESMKEVDININADIESMKEVDSSINADIESMKEVDSSIQENVANIISDIDTINADIESMKEVDSSINADIESMKEVDSSINADIESMKEVDSSIQENVANIISDIDTINADNNTIKEGMKSISDDNNVIKEDISLLKETDEKTQDDIDIIKHIIDVPPTYSKPIVSLDINPKSILMGSSSYITITPRFIQNDAGEVTGLVIKRNNEVVFESEKLESFTDLVRDVDTNQVAYRVEISYADGPIKFSTLGIPYPDLSIKAGTSSTSYSVKVNLPSYYGIVDSNDYRNLSELLNTNKSYTFENINLNDERFIYMYPSSYGDISSIKDSNNFDYINSYTKTIEIMNGVDYNVYILTDPVTIENFKQIFS